MKRSVEMAKLLNGDEPYPVDPSKKLKSGKVGSLSYATAFELYKKGWAFGVRSGGDGLEVYADQNTLKGLLRDAISSVSDTLLIRKGSYNSFFALPPSLTHVVEGVCGTLPSNLSHPLRIGVRVPVDKKPLRLEGAGAAWAALGSGSDDVDVERGFLEVWLTLTAAVEGVSPLVYAVAMEDETQRPSFLMQRASTDLHSYFSGGHDGSSFLRPASKRMEAHLSSLEGAIVDAVRRASRAHFLLLDIRTDNMVIDLDTYRVYMIDIDPLFSDHKPDVHETCLFFLNSFMLVNFVFCSQTNMSLPFASRMTRTLRSEMAERAERGREEMCRVFEEKTFLDVKEVRSGGLGEVLSNLSVEETVSRMWSVARRYCWVESKPLLQRRWPRMVERRLIEESRIASDAIRELWEQRSNENPFEWRWFGLF